MAKKDSKFKIWFSEIKKHKKAIVLSLLFFLLAGIAYTAAGDYLLDHAKNTAVSPDAILDSIGPYNLSFIFIWLFLAVNLVYFAYPIIYRTKEIAYTINMFSLFVIVRSAFIMFTHLRPPADAIHAVYPWFLQFLNYSNDLFFSGHTGVPFLGFLIFSRYNKTIAYAMLASSIILGITVLLMHVHYSIDVFSAYFITYGIYVIGNKLFKKG